MTTDVGFLYAMAGVSMSVASIAGLVVAFRRTGTWAALDLYRLRQIVEWGFANASLSLAAFPLASWLGAEASAMRVLGVVALAYLAVNVILLFRRRAALRDAAAAREVVPVTPFVVAVDIAAIMLTTATAILGTMAAWESALIAMALRPMIAFVWVLATLRAEGDAR